MKAQPRPIYGPLYDEYGFYVGKGTVDGPPEDRDDRWCHSTQSPVKHIGRLLHRALPDTSHIKPDSIRIAGADCLVRLTDNPKDDLLLPTSLLKRIPYFGPMFKEHWSAESDRVSVKDPITGESTRVWHLGLAYFEAHDYLSEYIQAEDGSDRDYDEYLLMHNAVPSPDPTAIEAHMNNIERWPRLRPYQERYHSRRPANVPYCHDYQVQPYLRTMRLESIRSHKILFKLLCEDGIQGGFSSLFQFAAGEGDEVSCLRDRRFVVDRRGETVIEITASKTLSRLHSEAMTCLFGLMGLVDLYFFSDCIGPVAGFLADLAMTVPDLWRDVAKRPDVWVGIASKLRMDTVYCEAMRHVVGCEFWPPLHQETLDIDAETLLSDLECFRQRFEKYIDLLDRDLQLLGLTPRWKNTEKWGLIKFTEIFLNPIQLGKKTQEEAMDRLARATYAEALQHRMLQADLPPTDFWSSTYRSLRTNDGRRRFHATCEFLRKHALNRDLTIFGVRAPSRLSAIYRFYRWGGETSMADRLQAILDDANKVIHDYLYGNYWFHAYYTDVKYFPFTGEVSLPWDYNKWKDFESVPRPYIRWDEEWLNFKNNFLSHIVDKNDNWFKLVQTAVSEHFQHKEFLQELTAFEEWETPPPKPVRVKRDSRAEGEWKKEKRAEVDYNGGQETQATKGDSSQTQKNSPHGAN